MSKNLLLAIGLAVARHQLAEAMSSWGLLTPRQTGRAYRNSHWPENLAYLGTGLVVGGVAALLLAPASGQVTRAQLSKKAAEALAEVAAGAAGA
jgi:hypothetical protein